MPDLLLEIGAEEIPAGYIPPALEALAVGMDQLLTGARIGYDGVESLRVLATPRRLTLFASGLIAAQEPITVEVSGPSKKVAYDDQGKPAKPLIGFCRSQDVALDAVRIKQTPKGDYCVVDKADPGRKTVEVLAEQLPGLITGLPFPKSMYWTERALTFARPIRNLVALLGEKFVPFEIGGVAAGRETEGHPFLAPGRIELKDADLETYKKKLEKAYVLVDLEARRDQLQQKIEKLLSKHGKGEVDNDLLDQVTLLVEWPGVLEGEFDKAFLDLPEEILIESMRYHQRFFPVRDAGDKLVNRFVAVHNRTDKQAKAIRGGCERVLTARLDDARFFWDHDRKVPLEEFAGRLSGIEYLQGLGSVADKSIRLATLCQTFSRHVPAPGYKGDAEKHATEAGGLCKADLLTEMVGEFPRLQGIMGGFYALEQKKNPEVVLAIAEHYLPRNPTDALPKTKLGVALSLADKFDHLAGCFALSLKPTGSSDPFALRRAAMGILRIFRAQQLDIGLGQWAVEALEQIRGQVDFDLEAVRSAVVGFVLDRLEEQYIRDGGDRDLFAACRFNRSDNPTDLETRITALKEVTGKPNWPSLQELAERTFNIAKPIVHEEPSSVDESLLEVDEERAVWRTYRECHESVQKLFDEQRYAEAAEAYEAALAEPVHWFFDKVFVNVEDERVRANRVSILKHVNLLFTRNFANLAALHVPEELKPQRGRKGSAPG